MATLLFLVAALGQIAPAMTADAACDLLAQPIHCPHLLIKRHGETPRPAASRPPTHGDARPVAAGPRDDATPFRAGRSWRPARAASPLSDGEDLCDGDFAENCLQRALSKCKMAVTEVKGSIAGTTATCKYTCNGFGTLQQEESCDLGALPIAACLYPACPDACLSCTDLTGELECVVTVSDDPDPSANMTIFEDRPPKWVCR